jgi:hypothetical protein
MSSGLTKRLLADEFFGEEIKRKIGEPPQPGNVPDPHGTLERPRLGATPAGYEAIVKRYGRPSLLIRNDSFEAPASDIWSARLHAAKNGSNARCVPSVAWRSATAIWIGSVRRG